MPSKALDGVEIPIRFLFQYQPLGEKPRIRRCSHLEHIKDGDESTNDLSKMCEWNGISDLLGDSESRTEGVPSYRFGRILLNDGFDAGCNLIGRGLTVRLGTRPVSSFEVMLALAMPDDVEDAVPSRGCRAGTR